MASTPDIGLNPPKAGNVHSRTGIMNDALAQFGSIVVSYSNINHADMATSTTAGDPTVMGVVTSQGDPNNSGLFAVGDQASVRDLGDTAVLVLGAGAAYARGDRIIQSTTAGVGKKLAGETGDLCMVGEVLQDCTTGAAASQLISVRVNVQRIKI